MVSLLTWPQGERSARSSTSGSPSRCRRCSGAPACTPRRSRASRSATALGGGAAGSANRWISLGATASSEQIKCCREHSTGSTVAEGPRTGSSTCTSGTRTRPTTHPTPSANRSPTTPSPHGTEEVRQRNWSLPGPHSAQEPWGFRPDEWGKPGPRSPWNLASASDVKQLFDGYDTGVLYADHAVGVLANRLADLGVLDETAICISSDHGEAFGELGVYADHQAADEATAHIPAVLSWPSLGPSVQSGLAYHLDVAATVVDLAGTNPPEAWDGRSLRRALETAVDAPGRDHLVITQGAWTAQRGVRCGDYLYLATRHDGYQAAWPEEMLFDVRSDPHEQVDLAERHPSTTSKLRGVLDEWVSVQLDRGWTDQDPLTTILDEGGPFHVRGKLPEYLDRLRSTGRADWADRIAGRESERQNGPGRSRPPSSHAVDAVTP